MKTYCCDTDATALETKMVTCIFGWNAQNKPRLFKSGLPTTDLLKVSNEYNVVAAFRQDHEIAAVTRDMSYVRCQQTSALIEEYELLNTRSENLAVGHLSTLGVIERGVINQSPDVRNGSSTC